MIYLPGLAIGLSPKPMLGTEGIFGSGVDWMAPKPGWIEGVLTTVGCRGVDNIGATAVIGGGCSGCSSSSSRSKRGG